MAEEIKLQNAKYVLCGIDADAEVLQWVKEKEAFLMFFSAVVLVIRISSIYTVTEQCIHLIALGKGYIWC